MSDGASGCVTVTPVEKGSPKLACGRAAHYSIRPSTVDHFTGDRWGGMIVGEFSKGAEARSLRPRAKDSAYEVTESPSCMNTKLIASVKT